MAPFFHAWQSFPVFDGIFLPGRSGSNIGDSLAVDSLVLACYFDLLYLLGHLMLAFVCIMPLATVINVLCSGHYKYISISSLCVNILDLPSRSYFTLLL